MSRKFYKHVRNGVYCGPPTWFGELSLEKSENLKSLGTLEQVVGDLFLRELPFLEDLGALKFVRGEDSDSSPFKKYLKSKAIGRVQIKGCPKIKMLTNLVSIDGDLDLIRSCIKDLGSLSKVGNTLRVDGHLDSYGSLETVRSIDLHLWEGAWTLPLREVSFQDMILPIPGFWAANMSVLRAGHIAALDEIENTPLTQLPLLLHDIDLPYKHLVEARMRGSSE